ncbi:MAG TPA: MOSC domain-containing protein [Propionibacteriaceae bacterium]|nr:MOSC domain-containing protein [Propionibacteriaceae bacterium]
MPVLDSVNLGHPVPNPYKDTRSTGFVKLPQLGPVEVRAPGAKRTGLGSGLVGDYVGDGKHHGGDDQALYAFAREDLDDWERMLGRELGPGSFGENLTTRGLDVSQARLGERWQIGSEVVVQVRSPRVPCATFRGQMGERGWLKRFTADERPGAYLKILTPGSVSRGDPIEVVHRPDHDVTIAMSFRALMTDRSLLPLMLAAGDDLLDEMAQTARAYSAT